jgi:outer membrane protein OmpA-like peptidoglycan-associated protein
MEVLRVVAVALGIACFSTLLPGVATAPAAAEDLLSKEEIIERLQGPPRTRSLILGGGEMAAGSAGWVPDLRVTFSFNSAELTPEARLQLDILAEALLDDQLATGRFEIAGHTDAVGSPSYNQQLSERRAKAAHDYLVRQRRIAPERLVPKVWSRAALQSRRARGGREPPGRAPARRRLSRIRMTDRDD